ncbi:MAG: hypothetical protein KJ995_05215 [Candidatus Omnitrophica bacterium]|nr:hypothetical protein [Candidatus Omnitrophota bacterium]MBU1128734.1 hypothetical protein [Candidatus Omnitrophota bacterium]MBU1784010.1 hypothetical protein [Candidatus Omnitrophota bacterium]MBU1851787.1 hypothetical protein [Candidatus Omnitrophota bacterium]
MKRMFVGVVLLMLTAFLVTGCGATIHGMVEDTKRIGGGVKTIFVRDGQK